MFLLVLDFEDDLVTIILQTFIFSCTPHTVAQCDKEHIIAKEKKKTIIQSQCFQSSFVFPS